MGRRAQAEANGWSLRETVINQQNRQTFIGSASTVAAAMNRHVQEDAADGFVLVPHLTPGGLDSFVDQVVPLLRERGVFRTSYSGTTLRDHLGLSSGTARRTPPAGSGASLPVTRRPRVRAGSRRARSRQAGPRLADPGRARSHQAGAG